MTIEHVQHNLFVISIPFFNSHCNKLGGFKYLITRAEGEIITLQGLNDYYSNISFFYIYLQTKDTTSKSLHLTVYFSQLKTIKINKYFFKGKKGSWLIFLDKSLKKNEWAEKWVSRVKVSRKKVVHSFYRTIFLSFMYRALIFGIFVFWCYELYWGKKLTFLCKINNLFLKIFKVFSESMFFREKKWEHFFEISYKVSHVFIGNNSTYLFDLFFIVKTS